MTEIGLGHYLTLGAVIFSIGIIGIFLNRKNIIVILMSIELILLAVNINLVAFSIFLGDLSWTSFYSIYFNSCGCGSCYWISNYSCLLPKLWNYTS